MNQYRDLFLKKLSTDVTQLRRLLAVPQRSSADINEMIRIFHNLKSDAAMMRYDALAMLARLTEKLLEGLHDQPHAILELDGLLQKVAGTLESTMKTIARGGTGMDLATISLCGELTAEIRKRGINGEPASHSGGIENSIDR